MGDENGKSELARECNKLSGPYPTLEVLLDLGFEDRPPFIQIPPSLQWMVPTTLRSPSVNVCYPFAGFDLVACPEIKRFGQYVVRLTGVRDTRRSLEFIEGEIPSNLGNALEAAAWITYALQLQRSQLEPLPDWFVEGERHWHLIPFVAEELAYRVRPKCFIDRNYGRSLRRGLLEEISRLAEETKMTFAFDGRVLSIDLCLRVHEVIASGDSWPSSYQVIVSPETTLPARFTSAMVEVSVFEDYVRLAGLHLGPCEAVA